MIGEESNLQNTATITNIEEHKKVQQNEQQNQVIQDECKEKKVKNGGEKINTTTSISTSNKIAYDTSIDEFSRQQIPSENDMSKGIIKQSNNNQNKHLKPIPEMSPFKSLTEKNPPPKAANAQTKKFQYSTINNNTVCIEKLEFKINQPKKDTPLKQGNTYWKRERLNTHSEGVKITSKKQDNLQSQSNQNFYLNGNRRQTIQESFKKQDQRITISESPKKSSRYTKIFSTQINYKDQSPKYNCASIQFTTNSLIGQNNDKSIFISNNNRDQRNDLDNKRKRENYCIVRQKAIPEQRDNTCIQNIAQKVVEISRSQQEYIQRYNYTPIQNNTYNQQSSQSNQYQQQPLQPIQQLQYAILPQQQLVNQQNQQIQILQPQQQQLFQQPLQQQQQLLQQQQQQQYQQLQQQQQQQQQQYFSQQPIRNPTLQQVFVPYQQNNKHLLQFQQSNSIQLISNQNIFQPINNDSFSKVKSHSLEYPQRFCSTGVNPYSQHQKRIFTEISNRDVSPKFSGKANSIRLFQGRASVGVIGGDQYYPQTLHDYQNLPDQTNLKQVYILNSETKPQINNNLCKNNTNNIQCRQSVPYSSNNSSLKGFDSNTKGVEQRRSTQGRIRLSNDENRGIDTLSSQNSFSNPNKFINAGNVSGARFSFCKTYNSQQEINSSQMQDMNKEKILNQINNNRQSIKQQEQAQQYQINVNMNNNHLNDDINIQNQITDKSTAAGQTLHTSTDQLNTNGNIINTYKSQKQQIEIAPLQIKLSADRNSQRRSLSSCGRGSIYSPLKNYFQENPIKEQSQENQKQEDDKLGITPISMMKQRIMPAATPEELMRRLPSQEKKDREITADPIEMYPSQYEPQENQIKSTQNNVKQLFYESSKQQENQRLKYLKIIENQDIDECLLNNNSKVAADTDNLNKARSPSGKKFELDKLKSIITSDTKNVQCSQYIDEYTSVKNKELLEKYKNRIHRNHSLTVTNSSADNNIIDKLTNSFEKNSFIIRNIDNRSSFSVSRNNSSWNHGYPLEGNYISQSIETNKLLQNQQIFQSNQNTSLAITPNNIIHSQASKEIKEQVNINPFTLTSFIAAPINKNIDNELNNNDQNLQSQDISSAIAIKQKVMGVQQNSNNLFLEKQKELQNIPAINMVSDHEDNTKFQKNMLISAQPQAKQINEEIESKRTQFETDRQAPPALLLQTCNSYQLKFRPCSQSPYKSNQNPEIEFNNTQNNKQQINQNNNTSNSQQQIQSQQSQSKLNKFENNNQNQVKDRNRSVSQGAIFSKVYYNEVDKYYSEQIIKDDKDNINNQEENQINSQLQQKYNQIIQSINQKNNSNSQQPKHQQFTEEKFITSIPSSSYTFTRKKSATELCQSNNNSKNSLSLSTEFKRKSLFLPPKPQLQQQPNNLSLCSILQNQSYEDIKRGYSSTNSMNKISKNQIFKNPKSIKDSIIHGRTSTSQASSSLDDVKIRDMFVTSINSPTVQLSDFYNNQQNILTHNNNPDIVCYNQNAIGDRLNTFEESSQFEISQTPNPQTQYLHSQAKYSNSYHTFADKDIAQKIISIQTEPHIQEEDKENTNDSHVKTNNFPLFSEFFSSIQKEYQKSIQENGVQKSLLNPIDQSNCQLSTKEGNQSYGQSGATLGQNIKNKFSSVESVDKTCKIQKNNPVSSIFSSYQPKQIDFCINENEELNGKQALSSQQSIRQNYSNLQNIRSYQQSKSNFDNDSSIFNKSNTTIPQNEQAKSISDIPQNKYSSNILKEQSQNNFKNFENSYKQSQQNQDIKKTKQKVFQQGICQYKDKKKIQQENIVVENIKRTRTSNNQIFQVENEQRNNNSNNSYNIINNSNNNSNFNNISAINNVIHNNNNNSNNFNNSHNYSNSNNNSNMLIQYPSSSKTNTSTIHQHSQVASNPPNTQPFATQSNVPTQQSLQNISNISKLTDCSNSKLIQIFLANSQLDQLTGGQNNAQKNFKQPINSQKDLKCLANILNANQQLANSIQSQLQSQQQKQQQKTQSNNNNFCINCKTLISQKEFAAHVHNCNQQKEKKELSNKNSNLNDLIQLNEELHLITQNEQTQQLQQKLIECNKTLEIVKVQAFQKLHSGEQFQVSRLCLYVNFFIECLNLIIINNQSYKELKSSLNDLTAIMEKIAISADDDHSKQFLQFAHKGYEIGLQKLGIIKRLK